MKANRAQVLRLLKTAWGQLDGIIKMVEEDRYCMEISTQVMATQSLLGKVNRQILHAHIQGCVQEAFEQGTQKEKLEEIEAVLDKILR